MKTAAIIGVTLVVAGIGGYFLYKAFIPSIKLQPPAQKPGTPPSSPLVNDFTKLGVDVGGWAGTNIGGSTGGYLGGALSGLLGYAGSQLGGLFS